MNLYVLKDHALMLSMRDGGRVGDVLATSVSSLLDRGMLLEAV